MKRFDADAVQEHELRHGDLVRRLAAECTLFLKYSGAFPVQPCKAALYGNGARRTIKGGKGSGDVSTRYCVSVEEGLERAGFEVTTKDWLTAFAREEKQISEDFVQSVRDESKATGTPPILVYYSRKEKPVCAYPVQEFAEGDICLYVLARDTGEGGDRSAGKGDFLLTDTEIEDIRALAGHYPKFCLVLNVAAPVDLSPVLDNVKDIFLLGQTGASVGDVCADILTGKSYPSGKLTATWAKIGDYPSTAGFGSRDDTFYNEGIFVGYRYFDTAGKKPLFPFGFGKGYTNFTAECVGYSADERKVEVAVKVTNTGNFCGKETIQLYVSAPSGDLAQPFQKLCAYRKTQELSPGESESLHLSFPTKELASFDEKAAAYVIGHGDYIVRVGTHSRDTKPIGMLRMETSATVAVCDRLHFDTAGLNEICVHQVLHPAAEPVICLRGERFSTEDLRVKEQEGAEKSLPGKGYTFGDVLAKKISLHDFVRTLSTEELARLCVGDFSAHGSAASMIGNASARVAGGAGDTCARLKDKKIPAAVTADGPAGLRLNTEYGFDAEGNIVSQGMVPEDLRVFAPERFAPVEIPGKKYYQYCTAIPVGTALAQSWNETLIEQCGDIVGEEMELFGVNLWLAPAMNIQRSPLCGRNFEYYSEDPLISGKCAAAITRGVQKHKGCGVTIKHFCCNNQETNREHSNSVVGERALREIYLKGFEICVREASPAAVMSSYNLVDGEHTANSEQLIKHILRGEWKFKGFVMTDWYATGGLKPYDGKYQSADCATCIRAGNDLVMPGYPKYYEEILNGAKEGKFDGNDLCDCAERILTFLKNCCEQGGLVC